MIFTLLQATIFTENISRQSYLLNDILPRILERVMELISAPKNNPDMIWMVVPLVVTLLLMTFYFGRYETEELGWNTAVGNSLVLFFISIDLLRQIYNGEVGGILNPSILNFEVNALKTAISLAVGFLGIMLLLVNFLHAIPKKVSFFMSSSLPINLTAYVAMTIIYTDVKFDRTTLIAALVLFFLFLGAIQMIKLVERIFLRWSTEGEVVILPKTRAKKAAKKESEEKAESKEPETKEEETG